MVPVFASISCPCSSFACLPGCFYEKVAWGNHTTETSRYADMPVLWTHHATLRNMLPGVLAVTQASLI
jgi:hypothetical protein